MNEVTEGPLLIRRDGSTAVLTLNRPDARNALDADLLHRLAAALAGLGESDAVRAVVITGAGDRAFCAGADIRQMRGMTADDGRRWSQLGHQVFQQLEDLPLPVIAAINGAAVGGGCELALACDFRFMAEGAVIGQPEIKLGMLPGWGGTQRLPRLIGLARAKELVLTGRLMDAQEAERAGLINAVTPSGQTLARALEFAAQFASLPPLAVRFAKRAMNLGRDLSLREASGVEIEAFAQCFATEDRVEGLAAFLEKRPPQFRGR